MLFRCLLGNDRRIAIAFLRALTRHLPRRRSGVVALTRHVRRGNVTGNVRQKLTRKVRRNGLRKGLRKGLRATYGVLGTKVSHRAILRVAKLSGSRLGVLGR